MTSKTILIGMIFWALAACSDDTASRATDSSACDGVSTDGNTSNARKADVGHEILQVVSPTEILAWVSTNITTAEFEALELPSGWIKNSLRETEGDGGSFAKSPGASVDGVFDIQEHFGFSWRHVATIVQTNIQLDEQGLLIGSQVVKSHELTFEACRSLVILISPQRDMYVRVTRDAGRSSDIPTLPNGWERVDYQTPEQLVLQLPDTTLVIRADNQDSFQGPIPELSIRR